MLYVKYVHILAVFGVTGLEVGPDVIMFLVARSREVGTIRGVFRLAPPIGAGLTVLAVIGLVTGVILVPGLGYSYLAPWLVASYILFAAGGVRNLVILTPWRTKVLAAARRSPDNAPSEDLDRLLRDRKAKHAVWINLVIDAALIFDMVVRPLS